MNELILCVDDDANLLAALARQLRKEFKIVTAVGGEEGLAEIERNGAFAVVMSDLRMPGMDGISFLAQVRERIPEAVRIMLTGHADLDTAISAVNEGQIFRFLTKPCPAHDLMRTLAAAIEQYRLVRAEKELLEKTLSGSVRVLIEILSLVNPDAFGRASRVRQVVRQLAGAMSIPHAWRLDVASMLSHLGCVVVPGDVLRKASQGMELSTTDRALFSAHPKIGHDLLANIPRMDEVAEIIGYQEKHYDGSGIPSDNRRGEAIPLGARVLHVALHYDALRSAGLENRRALTELRRRSGWYDPKVLNALAGLVRVETPREPQLLMLSELKPGMLLLDDVTTSAGTLLITKGQEITMSILTSLRSFACTAGIREPIRVLSGQDDL